MRFVLSILLCTAGLAPAAEPVARRPDLFDVGLGHEFPDARATFEAVRALILDNYYTDSVTEDALYWAAVAGMLRHISPPNQPELGKLWTAAQYEPILNGLRGVQVSLGIKSTFNPTDGSLTVTEILRGSPANGILAERDRILRIDGKALKGLSTAAVEALLKGDAGTPVQLTVVRDIDVLALTLVRRQFKSPNLAVHVLTPRTALAEIKHMSTGIGEAVYMELDRLRDDGIANVVIDLRGNTGGVFIEALRLCELFLPAKSIMLRTQRRAGQQQYVSGSPSPSTWHC